jgi:curved DNA-binding protein CbpA
MAVATYEHYKILGVNIGAGFADITASYKKLCRAHHPDISDDPSSEELMKDINVAYKALRDKFMRETVLRNKQINSRPVRARRYSNPDLETSGQVAQKTETESPQTDAEAEIGAFSVIHDYFTAINNRDYIKAYRYLSSYDKAHITQRCFIEWRQSVARLYPMREFTITGGLTPAIVKFKDNKTLSARKFNVAVTEDNYADDSTYEGVIEKLVTKEYGAWKVFLGYKSVIELTRRFDERLETKRKSDINKRWEEYCTELCLEYNMYNIAGMRKIVNREIYRQRRYGGSFSLAVISIAPGGLKPDGQEELLNSAARTISSSLRQTDVSAYAGDGVFVILFDELKKRSSQEVLSRLVERIRLKAGAGLGKNADIRHNVETWSGGNKADMDAINGILAKFKKIM